MTPTQVGEVADSQEALPAHRPALECIMRVLHIVALAIALPTFLFLSDRNYPELYAFLQTTVLLPISCVLVIYEVATMAPHRHPAWFCLLLLPAWHLFGRFVSQWDYAPESPEWRTFAFLLVAAAVIFPFARSTRDTKDRKLLDTVLWVTLVGCSMLWLTSYVGVLRHEIYTIGDFKLGAEYTVTGRLIMRVLGMHPYRSGFIASAFVLLAAYLAVSRPTRPRVVAAAALALIFLPSVIISGGRMDMLGLTIGMLYLLLLAVQRLRLSGRKKALLLLCLTAIAILAAVACMNLVYRHVTHSIRDVTYGATTLTSRTDIWLGLMKSLSEHPRAVAFGFSWHEEAMILVNVDIALEDTVPHMHSSYLQVLAEMGVPGFMLAVGAVTGVVVNGVRIFRAGEAEGISLADKLLFAVPLCMIIESLTEIIIFADVGQCTFANTLFMLLSGYVVFTGEGLTGRASNGTPADPGR